MKVKEVIFAHGHQNVKATHKTTFEITKEAELTKRGNCIVAVSADKALRDLNPEFKKQILRENTPVTILFETGGVTDSVRAFGSSRLILTHPTDIVVRKSDYICMRTLAIKADKAACDLSRTLIENLRKPRQEVKITFTVNQRTSASITNCHV